MSHAYRHAAYLGLTAALLCLAWAEPASAQSLGGVEKVLQNIVVTGMAWMFGYLDLRKAGYVIFGVAILFGASEIVSTITGK